jgi:hypothetical protein
MATGGLERCGFHDCLRATTGGRGRAGQRACRFRHGLRWAPGGRTVSDYGMTQPLRTVRVSEVRLIPRSLTAKLATYGFDHLRKPKSFRERSLGFTIKVWGMGRVCACSPAFHVVQLPYPRRERMTDMGNIIQTLTLATVLLIVGSSCVVIGIAGLALLAKLDRLRIEKARRVEPDAVGPPQLVPSSTIVAQGSSVWPVNPRTDQTPARIRFGQPVRLVLDSGTELALIFQPPEK